MSTRRGQLQEGKDGLGAVIRLVNELVRNAPAPGVSFFPAAATMAAFKCVGREVDTNAAVLARADGSTYAVGVLSQAVNVGETAVVVTSGPIAGAVSGRAANDAVWVGDDGSLVFAAPGGASYVQPIAVCTSATDIFVSVGAPVI